MKKITKMTKLMLLSGLILSANQSFAQVKINFPDNPYSNTYLKSRSCDPNVYNRLYTKAKGEYDQKYTSIQKLAVRDQMEASPKEATNNMMKCVEKAVNQLDGLVSKAEGIYNLILGAGSVDLGAIGSSAINKLGEAACNSINNYTGSAVYSAVQPYNSVITSVPSTVSNGIGNVNTPVGNVNTGQIVTDAIKQQAGPTQKSTVVKDTVTNILK